MFDIDNSCSRISNSYMYFVIFSRISAKTGIEGFSMAYIASAIGAESWTVFNSLLNVRKPRAESFSMFIISNSGMTFSRNETGSV